MILSARYFCGLISIFVGCAALAGGTNFEDKLHDMPCAKKMREKVGPKLATQAWYPQLVLVPGVPLQNGIVFRDSRTLKVYKVWTETNRAAYLEQDLTTKQEALTVWDSSKKCEPQTITRATHQKAPLDVANGFTDEDVFSTVKKNEWGVIYVWTPYMPLSVVGIKEIKAAVKAKGGTMTILMDGKASMTEAQAWIAKGEITEADTKQVASHELYSRELGLHYPISFIYRKGFISNRTYFGYKSDAEYQAWIDLEMADMKKTME
jgi:hypothetical protein